MRVVVTGGSGRTGTVLIKELLAHGHTVSNLDVVPPREMLADVETMTLDLRDLGGCIEALSGWDAVVHLAAVWAPGVRPPAETFATNIVSTFNILQAAALTGVERLVWASSNAVVGSPFDLSKPQYLPIDEDHPRRPRNTYALSKSIGEELAPYFVDQGVRLVVNARLSWVLHPGQYTDVRSWWKDPGSRKFNLWSYADVRDVAQCFRRVVESDVDGAHTVAVAAADTCMNVPSADLVRDHFPSVQRVSFPDTYSSLISCDRAGELFGYAAEYSWRDELDSGQGTG